MCLAGYSLAFLINVRDEYCMTPLKLWKTFTIPQLAAGNLLENLRMLLQMRCLKELHSYHYVILTSHLEMPRFVQIFNHIFGAGKTRAQHRQDRNTSTLKRDGEKKSHFGKQRNNKREIVGLKIAALSASKVYMARNCFLAHRGRDSR